jgi:actin-related protein
MISLSLRNTNSSHTSVPRVCLPTIDVDRVILTQTCHAAAALIPYGQLFSASGLPNPECMLVVDAGFSFTHIVPIMGGSVLWSAVKRYVAFSVVDIRSSYELTLE